MTWIINATQRLVMVDTCAKKCDNWSKDVEVMLRKQIFHLTLACVFDLEHTDLDHIGEALACYGKHLCGMI